MNILSTINSKDVNFLIGSLILPSLLFPIKYSSLIIIITSIASLYNVVYKFKKKRYFKYLLLPFCTYYLSIILSFIIDLYNKEFNTAFLARNLSFLIIPLFIFSSNFSKKEILNILKSTTILITIIGIFFLVIWVFGYFKYNSQQEYLKADWFKKEVTIVKNDFNTSSIDLIINSSANKPSLRKVVMLNENQAGNSLVREFNIKAKYTYKNIWVLLRSENGDNKAWFNIVNGEVGFVEGNSKVKSEKKSNGYYKFTFTNVTNSKSTRDWFYISFVSSNGGFNWNNDMQKEVCLQLKPPKLFLVNGEDLLQKKSILNYKITHFSWLVNYAHSTYFGLVFTFALIILLFNTFLNKILHFSSIAIIVFIIITLASKAVAISIFLILPAYYLYNNLSFKFLIALLVVGFLISFNGHIKSRFLDMYQTIQNLDTKKMGDLKTLSTNNRLFIYKNHIELVVQNPIYGYGYKNGEEVIQSKLKSNFNAHNQYLQSLYNSGVFGFIIFVLFSISPFMLIKKVSKKKYGLDFLIILIIFNFLFESMLNRQWGLIFVSFIFAIYFQFFKLNLRWFR